jgi:diguanylate cyclase (GGDEF)-like protein/PAS domain S-box-containing protein
MLSKFSTYWRFLLPVLVLLFVAPFILMQQQTSLQLLHIEQSASDQAMALAQLLDSADRMVSGQVNSAMQLLKERGYTVGTPEIQGMVEVDGRMVPNLTLGGVPQANTFGLVDSVAGLLGGTATLFVKSGDEFIRISTNVRKSDGRRAVGTILNPNGKAISAIRAGKSFSGEVDILGEPYFTGYEPMHDAAGTVIGLWYVGYKMDTAVIRDAVENARHLDTGFAAVLDESNHIRFLSSHMPRAHAERLLAHRSSQWKIIEQPISNWGFKVVVAYPLSEARKVGLARSLFVILAGTLLGAFIVIIILWQLQRLVLNPIGGDPAFAIDVVQRIAGGNLEKDNLSARPGTLMANVLSMRKKLREMVNILHQNTERLALSASVFEHAHDGIFITDAKAKIIEINPAFSELSGYSREEALGRMPGELKFAYQDENFFERFWENREKNTEWRGETLNQRKDGDIYPASLDLFVVSNTLHAASYYVCVFSDITSLKEHRENLEYLAYHDPLTQLPNRALLADRLQQALARASRSKEVLSICYFDLDNFKPVNDALGHQAGDQLLVELARRVRTCLRESDTIARLGGDEFALLLCGLNTPEECQQTLDRLLAAINAPFLLGKQVVHVSASIGYTLFPFDGATSDTLMRHADHAMYQAKMNGGGHYHLFDAEHDRYTRDQRHARDKIEAALPNGEFCLYYQPKVNMRKGTVVGMEALIRWQHKDSGLRLPGDFLSVIENTDFIIELGEWVILEALDQMSLWQQVGMDMPVSVNIAARHLVQPDFATRLTHLLKSYPEVSPRKLELEITETAAIEDIASVSQIMNSCKQLGVTFALDDFGVGYSSLTYLRRLPAEVIKIDQSFVRDMLHDKDDLALIAGVISLSREFDRQVIAEGVETAEHGVQLMRMGCKLGQGHGIARPMPASSVKIWVETYKPDSRWFL